MEVYVKHAFVRVSKYLEESDLYIHYCRQGLYCCVLLYICGALLALSHTRSFIFSTCMQLITQILGFIYSSGRLLRHFASFMELALCLNT